MAKCSGIKRDGGLKGTAIQKAAAPAHGGSAFDAEPKTLTVEVPAKASLG